MTENIQVSFVESGDINKGERTNIEEQHRSVEIENSSKTTDGSQISLVLEIGEVEGNTGGTHGNETRRPEETGVKTQDQASRLV